MSEASEHLFVYGTLRRDHGHAMHRVLARYAEPLGEATLAGRLYDVGAYPAAVLAADGARIVGEVYRLRDRTRVLPRLDVYEGVPWEYRRVRAEVKLGGGALQAWVYVYNRDTLGLRSIESGDYLSWRGSHRRVSYGAER